MKKILNKLLLLFCTVVLFSMMSCHNNDVFSQYSTVALNGWNKDSTFIFNVQIQDIKVKYNVYVNVRNRGEYPYQNMWLFLEKMSPDSIVTKDTINFYLADQRGKWLGSGVGQSFEMPVLYQQNVTFHKPGTYRYRIFQGMRDTILVGVNDIGIRVEKQN